MAACCISSWNVFSWVVVFQWPCFKLDVSSRALHMKCHNITTLKLLQMLGLILEKMEFRLLKKGMFCLVCTLIVPVMICIFTYLACQCPGYNIVSQVRKDTLKKRENVISQIYEKRLCILYITVTYLKFIITGLNDVE